MPWFKVDDTFGFHHKAVMAGNSAVGLWCRAGSACMQQLTDGFVADHMLPVLGGKPKDAAALVATGLWVTVPGGWRFHQWDDFQPTAEQVKADRRAAADRQRRAREKARHRAVEKALQEAESHSVVTVLSRRDSRRTSVAVTVPPTRPDPLTTSSTNGEDDQYPTVCTARDRKIDDQIVGVRS